MICGSVVDTSGECNCVYVQGGVSPEGMKTPYPSEYGANVEFSACIPFGAHHGQRSLNLQSHYLSLSPRHHINKVVLCCHGFIAVLCWRVGHRDIRVAMLSCIVMSVGAQFTAVSCSGAGFNHTGTYGSPSNALGPTSVDEDAGNLTSPWWSSDVRARVAKPTVPVFAWCAVPVIEAPREAWAS